MVCAGSHYIHVHVQACAVLAAVSEVVKMKEGKDTVTDYFAALVSELIWLVWG